VLLNKEESFRIHPWIYSFGVKWCRYESWTRTHVSVH